MTFAQVSVKCGSTEKLQKVEEPSRCEYIATLLTPAACTPTEVQAIQDKLTALDQELEDEHTELWWLAQIACKRNNASSRNYEVQVVALIITNIM